MVIVYLIQCMWYFFILDIHVICNIRHCTWYLNLLFHLLNQWLVISDIVCYIFWFHIAWVLFCDIRWCTCMWYLWFQAVLFVWEQIQDSDHRMYHAHRSFAGVALVVLRILLAALFAWNLNVIVSSERSALRREFYKSFTKVCSFIPSTVCMAVNLYIYNKCRSSVKGFFFSLCNLLMAAFPYEY